MKLAISPLPGARSISVIPWPAFHSQAFILLDNVEEGYHSQTEAGFRGTTILLLLHELVLLGCLLVREGMRAPGKGFQARYYFSQDYPGRPHPDLTQALEHECTAFCLHWLST